MIARLTLLLMLVAAAGPAHAGRYNKVLNIGDQAPAWTELPGTDGQTHSLDDLQDKKAVVVFFTCNSCPYAMDAEDRLLVLNEKFSQRGVGVVAINVHKNEEDGLAAMKERAQEKGFKFEYLHDESQQIGAEFGAKYTPEFYVLDSQRRVAYMGALDDSPMGNKVANRYVELALEAVLSGTKPQITETAPIGCAIPYERIRRRRRADAP